MAEDFGMASVAAYFQPLSPKPTSWPKLLLHHGWNSATLGTTLLRSQLDGPQEAGLNFTSLIWFRARRRPQNQASGAVATFTETRLISPNITVTPGMDISYLGSIDSAFTAQPRMNVEYQASSQTLISAQLGSAPEGARPCDSLGALNAFPQITEQNGHLEMERLNHIEVPSIIAWADRRACRWPPLSRCLAQCRGLGHGDSSTDAAFAGNSLPNPAGNGIVINGGNYASTGFRAVFAKTFDSRVEVLGAVSTGTALSAKKLNLNQAYTQGELTPQQTAAFLGKVTAELPVTHTRISTSYECVPADRVTLVDPAMQGALQAQPYLGAQIRQPIPTPNSWPVRIDAVAEFQNLLSQGDVPSGQNAKSKSSSRRDTTTFAAGLPSSSSPHRPHSPTIPIKAISKNGIHIPFFVAVYCILNHRL